MFNLIQLFSIFLQVALQPREVFLRVPVPRCGNHVRQTNAMSWRNVGHTVYKPYYIPDLIDLDRASSASHNILMAGWRPVLADTCLMGTVDGGIPQSDFTRRSINKIAPNKPDTCIGSVPGSSRSSQASRGSNYGVSTTVVRLSRSKGQRGRMTK